MADHEDYLSGEAPMAHAASHESLGSDEISIAGLAGESAALAAHKILPSIHHLRYTDLEAQIVADAEIAIHAAIPTAHQNAPALIGVHAALPTVHQDAPALIETHRLVAGAHHAKYTNAEARAVHSPISIPPTSFFPLRDNLDWLILPQYLSNREVLTTQYFAAPVIFPGPITVTKVTLYAYCDDASSYIYLELRRTDRSENLVNMAFIATNWTDGFGSRYDDSINSALINNSLYNYSLIIDISPNDSVDDVRLTGVEIEFTG